MENIIMELKPGPSSCRVEARSILGDREQQQDRIYAGESDGCLFAVLCDGMGGMDSGAAASELAAAYFQAAFQREGAHLADDQGLIRLLRDADDAVFRRCSGSGGTTAVAAFVGGGSLRFASAGDSRLYILRGTELVQATRDHNYLLRLDELLQSGSISKAEYDAGTDRGGALISYLGVGGLPVCDWTQRPLALYAGDLLLLSSDGLSRAVAEPELLQLLRRRSSLCSRADSLIAAALSRQKTAALDNTSFILIEIP